MKNILLIIFTILMTSSCKGQEKQKSAYKLPNDSYVLDSTFISLKSSKFKIIILEKNKNKDIDEHYSNTLVVLKQNGNNYFEIYDNSKIVFNDDTNCPVDGYNSIVSKNNYFTIEQNICADFQFVNTYTTFKIDEITNEIFLHKYGQKYSDRSNPDRVIPDKTWTVKDFGKVNFVDFNKKFVIDLIQNNPKK